MKEAREERCSRDHAITSKERGKEGETEEGKGRERCKVDEEK